MAHTDRFEGNSLAKEKVILSTFIALDDFCSVCSGDKDVELAPDIWNKVEKSYASLAQCIDEKRVVYGITTGFGPLANRLMSTENIQDLQRNLIYHLATGVGEPLNWQAARAVMLDRLVSITRGWSGASMALVELIVRCLNYGLAPWVPQKGTVGASGDLTPCAHMALALMGEGAFITPQGYKQPAKETLALLDLTPFSLEGRDGLALVNGTSAMSGIAALNHKSAKQLLEWSVKLSVSHAELLQGQAEAWHPEFAIARPHMGQSLITSRLNEYIRSSQLIQKERLSNTYISDIFEQTDNATEVHKIEVPPQDPYTIRCVPQILGAVHDMIDFHERMVETEINSTTDNPLFQTEAPYALHGGNFYGQHVAFASDALKTALIKIAILAERQVACLTDEKLNKGLPAFLQPNTTGLHSGFMGAQVTATALLAELRSSAHPVSIQSIPTNGNNQDVVSMGTIAARSTDSILHDIFRILAIQALCVSQAMDLLIEGKVPGRRQYELSEFSETAQSVREFTRGKADFLDQDRPLSDDIETIAEEMI
ncbi:MAG: aromatic amino acid ammonia-lyase [Pseudomonadota bacterium]